MTGVLVLLSFGGFIGFVIWCSTDSGTAFFQRKLEPWRPIGRYLQADLRALRTRRKRPVEVPNYVPEEWGS